MGLDMYLTAEKYLSGWDHSSPTKRKLFAAIRKLADLKPTDIASGAPSGVLRFHAGYWRKANAIHSWFVANVQGGKDECEPHDVSRKQLEIPRGHCQQALKSIDYAKAFLPTKLGFFFGSMEYDDGYKQDLTDTIEVVDRCLSPAYEGWSFEYRSSW